ncbi:hypothetical protein [Roseobacter sp. AzwK-3b]|uniref:hypothetical protein n=1 Tax=Roseobacter sp. AzwK-3b TaxID=351016 RepID=UPI0018DCD326|nr:hypothetical protein [Roseobacter sp. AzwK-3b]
MPETGQIVGQVFATPAEIDANIPDGAEALYDAADVFKDYIVAGGVTPRPGLGLPDTHTLAANADWSLPDIPDGTSVLIDQMEQGVTSGGLVLSFPEAGEWTVELRPPFPYLDATCTVTVT